MRGIKFRAWDKKKKTMMPIIEIDWEYKEVKFREWESKDCENETVSDWARLEDTELMEFTGCKDKNGKEIYEGDMLRYRYSSTDFKGAVEFHDKILKIGWEGDEERFVGFILRGIDKDGRVWFIAMPNTEDIEIIGNIYENPKLLKGDK